MIDRSRIDQSRTSMASRLPYNLYWGVTKHCTACGAHRTEIWRRELWWGVYC